MVSPQCVHFRVPDSDSCFRQSIQPLAAFHSDRSILQKKMPMPIVARPAIARRKIVTIDIPGAGADRNPPLSRSKRGDA